MSMNFVTDVIVDSENTLQTKTIKALTGINETSTYGVGTDGQILKSNGTNAYWGNLDDVRMTKSYTNVKATSNDNAGGSFFFAKLRPTTYQTNWYVKFRIIGTVTSNTNYYGHNTCELWGYANTYSRYYNVNNIRNTSYRPIYYYSIFFYTETGFNNNCGNWIGFNLYNATNQTTVNRNITVEILDYKDCTIELSDTLYTPETIPDRSAHTGWYTSTYSNGSASITNLDACTAGVKMSGDANSTSISNLYYANGNYVADSALYRYQLVFEKSENVFTPLNNTSNTTGTGKTMLTSVEFNAFGKICYYSSTTTVAASGGISAGSLFYAYSGVDLRQTFNCGTTLTSHKPFYLVVTPTSGGMCKLASAAPWAQTLPIADDGNWYILLGRTYSTYQFTLYPIHPVYRHNGTEVEVVTQNMHELEPMANVEAMLADLGLSTSVNLMAAQAGTAETGRAVVQEG